MPLDRARVEHSGTSLSVRPLGLRRSVPTIPSIDDITGITAPDIGTKYGPALPTDGLGALDPGCSDLSICRAAPRYGAGPLSAGQVEKPALAIPGNARPLYPEMLRRAGIEGSVLMRFVIDTSGTVEPQSVQVVRADQELFAASVRSALRQHRFLPAEAAGRKVRMLVEQRFDFALNAR
jgi:TonB family protein